MGGHSSSNQSSQSQTSYDPELKAQQLGNYASAQQVAQTPFSAYTGSFTPGGNASLTGANSAAAALSQFAAPDVSTPDAVTADQIKGYTDPFQQNVIDAANTDINRQAQQQITQNQGAATAAGAYGGSRHGVVDALTNEAAQRTLASTDASLRSQGYQTALSASQADLARRLQAGQSNQSASVAGASVRQNAAGLLGNLGTQQQGVEQAGLQKAYEEFLRGQNWGPMMQQLLNQAAGVLPSGTTGTSSGSGSSSSFQLGPQSISIG